MMRKSFHPFAMRSWRVLWPNSMLLSWSHSASKSLCWCVANWQSEPGTSTSSWMMYPSQNLASAKSMLLLLKPNRLVGRFTFDCYITDDNLDYRSNRLLNKKLSELHSSLKKPIRNVNKRSSKLRVKPRPEKWYPFQKQLILKSKNDLNEETRLEWHCLNLDGSCESIPRPL